MKSMKEPNAKTIMKGTRLGRNCIASLSSVNFVKPAYVFVVLIASAFSGVLISSRRGSSGCMGGEEFLFPAAAEAGVEGNDGLKLLKTVVDALELS